MAINKQTIISAFDDKLTLLQWLKTINKALDEAVLTGVEVRQKGNATYSFVVTFEDGTELESNEFVLAQGESINGATIRNGHLYLSLTNGDELDAGNVKPVTSFEINASQHLIVNYGDGTSQDLGAIFTGNITIEGTLKQTTPNYTKPFIFNITGNFEITNVYNRFIVINNILYIIANIKITNTSAESQTFDRVPTAYVITSDNEDIYNNVYDIEGNTIGNGRINSEIFIAGDQAILLKGGTNAAAIRTVNQNYSIIAYNSNSPSNKTIEVFFEKTTSEANITLEAGQSLYLSGRIALSLL